MEGFNKKLRERWQQKRNKASNWTGLLIKILILVAIVFAIQRLTKSKNIDWSSIKTKPETVQTDSLR
ncbi:MAG: hypothetical protein FJ041_05265 [Candidatus Cloacimonetes bacterium]|nr:hypothetical protein [Candidatus Cloacimonadota bacterium]